MQEHGALEIRFSRSNASLENPFEGTSQARVKFTYQDCYADFYADNPQWVIDGGQLDLAEWNDAMCNTDPSDGTLADCAVVSVDQDLDAQPPSLTVTYEILGPFEGKTLFFGPLPSEDLVSCEGGFAPRVLISSGELFGVDAAGDPLWSLVSVSHNELAPGDSVAVRAAAASE